MDNINWTGVEESNGSYAEVTPGAYAAKILDVEDNTGKKYLRFAWDFADGPLKGDNTRCYEQQGFTPSHGIFIRTYDATKPRGLGMLKKLIVRLEKSNRGFQWDNANPAACVGKYFGVVLGEEEYWSTKYNEVRKRLVVADVLSGEELRAGDYKVPPLKKFKGQPPAAAPGVPYAQPQPYAPQEFTELGDEEELPF